jgi:hypothetical protein
MATRSFRSIGRSRTTEKSLLVRLRRPRPAVHQIIDDRRCRIAACFGAIIILVAGDGAIDRRGAKA